MDEYQRLVRHVLENGTKEKNRTKEDTISTFGYNYAIDVGEGYPLLTSKKMDTFRWDSMLHELEWYLSGKHHVRELTEKTGIWDAWADENHNLPSAYGRFWRRYPVPEGKAQLPGEEWINPSNPWTNSETPIKLDFAFKPSEKNVLTKVSDRLKNLQGELEGTRFYLDKPVVSSTDDYKKARTKMTVCKTEGRTINNVIGELRRKVNPYDLKVEDSYLTFDQLKFVVDALNNDNDYRGPESRRLIVQAWHPSNAQVSNLPPCHFSYLFNVQNDRLNLHLTQRSADIALGVPFNIAAYSVILKLIAQETSHDVGVFNHTLVDAHIYCGKDSRSEWYTNNLQELQRRVSDVDERSEFNEIKKWILDNAPDEDADTDPENGVFGYDHVPGLVEQISREPYGRSDLNIAEEATIDNVDYEDFKLENYESHPGLRFGVAE